MTDTSTLLAVVVPAFLAGLGSGALLYQFVYEWQRRRWFDD